MSSQGLLSQTHRHSFLDSLLLAFPQAFPPGTLCNEPHLPGLLPRGLVSTLVSGSATEVCLNPVSSQYIPFHALPPSLQEPSCFPQVSPCLRAKQVTTQFLPPTLSTPISCLYSSIQLLHTWASILIVPGSPVRSNQLHSEPA